MLLHKGADSARHKCWRNWKQGLQDYQIQPRIYGRKGDLNLRWSSQKEDLSGSFPSLWESQDAPSFLKVNHFGRTLAFLSDNTINVNGKLPEKPNTASFVQREDF